jgi:hypothetical protein
MVKWSESSCRPLHPRWRLQPLGRNRVQRGGRKAPNAQKGGGLMAPPNTPIWPNGHMEAWQLSKNLCKGIHRQQREIRWRAPKFLVRPKKGPTMLKSESSWNLVPLPASSTKGGWNERAESSGIRLGRGTSYLVTRSCIQNQPTSWLVHIRNILGVENKPRATLDSLNSPRPGLGGSHHLPPYSILCVTSPHLHPNGSFSRDSQNGIPKLSRFGLPGLWTFITSCSDLRLGWGLKQTCSSPSKLSNGLSHSTFTHRDRVDSWLLVVGSQIASLTPDLSFDHNLCRRYPNGPCEAILDIYTSRPFQWYKEHLEARCFDSCNRTLSFRKSRRTLKSHLRECEWRPHTSLKVGLWHPMGVRRFRVSQDLDSRGRRIEAANSIRKFSDHSPLVLSIWGQPAILDKSSHYFDSSLLEDEKGRAKMLQAWEGELPKPSSDLKWAPWLEAATRRV